VANRLLAARVLVLLIGPAHSDCIPDPEFIRRARTEGWLDLIDDVVPRNEARKLARTSDGLLLLQPQSATQVPGKLFEYLQIGRPILAFIQPDSPSERLLAQSGVPYRCVYPDSAPEAVDDVVAEFFGISSNPVAACPWFEEHFSADKQACQLDTLISSLHDGTKAAVRIATQSRIQQIDAKEVFRSKVGIE